MAGEFKKAGKYWRWTMAGEFKKAEKYWRWTIAGEFEKAGDSRGLAMARGIAKAETY